MNRARILKTMTTRIYVLFTLFFCFGVLMSGQLINLQLIQGKSLRLKAKTQYQSIAEVTPARGNIYDRLGHKLALNIQVKSVAAIPPRIRDVKKLCKVLGPLLDMGSGELRRKLSSNKHFVWLKRKVDEETIRSIKSMNLEGIVFRQESKRVYPKGSLAGQVLGFSGLDNQGLGGVEASLEKYLRGHPGRVLREMDCFGRSFIPAERILKDPLGGNDVCLTIDQFIQFIAERELARGIREEQADGGNVIVMDVQTGEILAMALAPTFDPNLYSNRRLKIYPSLSKTRTATDSLEPGSTIKSLVIAAALDAGVVKPSTRIFCGNGKISVGGHTFTDWQSFGTLTVEEILKFSSDVGAIRIGMRMGKKLLETYFRVFGLESRTGIELFGEDRGKIPSYWSTTSVAAVSFGYEVMVTPIQLVSAFSTFANGGYLVKPRILKKVCRPDGTVIFESKPRRVRRVISAATAETMVKLLEKVVEEGTGKKAAINGIPVAGKTGTVEKYDPKSGRYMEKTHRTLFVGFCPSRPDPRVAILVILDSPRRNVFGGTSAAPIFSRLARNILNYIDSKRPHDSNSNVIIACSTKMKPGKECANVF